jgi:hypothetical protein
LFETRGDEVPVVPVVVEVKKDEFGEADGLSSCVID